MRLTKISIIIRSNKLMIIFAKQNDFGHFSPGGEVNPVIGTFSKNYKVSTLVKWIAGKWYSSPEDIDCLYLCAHGNAGKLNIGDQVDIDSAQEFNLLRGMFSPDSRGIEIHGCACASSTDIGYFNSGTPSAFGKGYDFLNKLAHCTGVMVTAPVDSVWGSDAAYSYQGVRTMTVLPGGSAYFGYGS